MLLQRKSLAFVIVAPFGKRYLIFMLLNVCKWTDISPAKIIKILQNVLYYDERNCIGPV